MTHDEIRAAIAVIPEGEVRTYSDITPEACAQVGKVQNQEPTGWHRVVFKKGELKNNRQLELLKAEGVLFDEKGRVILKEQQMPG